MGKQYTVGVIGYGLSAKIFHIPFINAVPELKLSAIVQRHPTPQNNAARDYPDVKIYASAKELMSDAQVDIVVVTTTPETHFRLSSLALKAKKHVVVEKPFTPTAREAQQLFDLAATEGVVLAVYQNRRFDSDFRVLQQLMKNNTFGQVVEFESHFDRHQPQLPDVHSWRTSKETNSALSDLGSHLIDQIIALFGFPDKITGFVGSQRDYQGSSNMEDSCTVLLHYSHMLATIKVGVVSPEQAQLRFWVRGDLGSYKKFHLDPQEDQVKAGLLPGAARFGEEGEESYGTLTLAKGSTLTCEVVPSKPAATYAEFYRQLVLSLQNNDPRLVPVSANEAVGVIRLIELARESARTGRTQNV